MKKFVLTLVSTILCLGAGSAFADHHKGHGKAKEAMMKELKLTPEQKTQMDNIHKTTDEKFEALFTRMKATKEKMKNAIKADVEADIRAAHDEMQTIKAEMGKLKFDTLMEKRKILNPDQRKKLAGMKMDKKKCGDKECMMQGHDCDHDED